jgi:hypothetical protein
MDIMYQYSDKRTLGYFINGGRIALSHEHCLHFLLRIFYVSHSRHELFTLAQAIKVIPFKILPKGFTLLGSWNVIHNTDKLLRREDRVAPVVKG